VRKRQNFRRSFDFTVLHWAVRSWQKLPRFDQLAYIRLLILQLETAYLRSNLCTPLDRFSFSQLQNNFFLPSVALRKMDSSRYAAMPVPARAGPAPLISMSFFWLMIRLSTSILSFLFPSHPHVNSLVDHYRPCALTQTRWDESNFEIRPHECFLKISGRSLWASVFITGDNRHMPICLQVVPIDQLWSDVVGTLQFSWRPGFVIGFA
jgi:hypothetical protein